MRVKCDYCGNYIEDTEKNCPHCGAPNERMQRSGTKIPRTIEDLKAFCAAHHLPLEQMRFFLGEDYRGPRAFGIYRDGEGNFIVYKNKSDGSRAVRYRGTDEAYAVNELYQKMKSEISSQRARQQKDSGKQKGGSGKNWLAILIALYFGINIIPSLIRRFQPDPPPTGYYTYEDTWYYCQNDDWYYYDTGFDSWTPTTVPATLGENYEDYFDSSSYSDSEAPADFSDSAYYFEPDYDSDWDDDDWDWDSGDSWDSGSTDWDSDW